MRSQHQHSPDITIFARGGKFKIESAPQIPVSSLIALEPKSAQVDILVEHLHLHFSTMSLRCRVGLIFNTQSMHPIKDYQPKRNKPDNRCDIKHTGKNNSRRRLKPARVQHRGKERSPLTKMSQGIAAGDAEVIPHPLKRSHSYRGVTFSACGPF